jgi:hypothetical protein
LGCNVMQFGRAHCFLLVFYIVLLFEPKSEDSMFHQNVTVLLPVCTPLHYKTKLRGLSLQVNYMTAACRRSSYKLLRIEGATWSAWGIPKRPYSRLSRLEPLLFLPSSTSIVLTRLSAPCSRPTASQKIW